ncbi:MAG: CBS domain-containing protein [Planctomycetota bacterium]|nr:CBS domain-containing protein [Planctomycetota bacterium]
MSTSVRRVMNPVSTLSMTSTVDRALHVLVADRVDSVYITDDTGCLVGILPDYEILKSVLAGTHTTQIVGEIVTRHIQTIPPDTPVYQIAARLREWRTQSLAVVEDGRILGRVTRSEVLESLTHGQTDQTIRCDIDEDEDEEPVLRSALAGPRFARLRNQQPQRTVELG